MTQNQAILVAAGAISAVLLTQLAYNVVRNVGIDRTAETEKKTQAENAMSQYKRVQEKAAWDAATHKIDDDLEAYLNARYKEAKTKFKASLWAVTAKDFSRSDVAWIDANHIAVRGMLDAMGPKGRAWFSWNRKMLLSDSGVWTDVQHDAHFATATVTDSQWKELPKVEIRELDVARIFK